VKYPIDSLPDLTDTTLVGSWLNSATKGTLNNYVAGRSAAAQGHLISYNNVGGTYLNTVAGGRVIDSSLNNVTEFTFNCWISPSAAASTTAAYFWTKYYVGFSIDSNFNKACLFYSNFAGDFIYPWSDSGSAQFEINGWQMLTYQISNISGNNFTINIFFNGELIFTSDRTDGLYVHGGTNYFYIGCNTTSISSSNLSGKLKDVRFYSEAKNTDWVRREYQKCVPDNSLIGSWFNKEKVGSYQDLSLGNTWLNRGNGDAGFDNEGGKIIADTSGASVQGTITYYPLLNINSNFTLSAYIKMDTKYSPYIIYLATNKIIYMIIQQYDTSYFRIRCAVVLGTDTSSTSLYSDQILWDDLLNGYCNIVITISNNTGSEFDINFYFNGDPVGTSHVSNYLKVSSSNDINIGGSSAPSSSNFVGKIRDINIYNEAKSSQWIEDRYKEDNVDGGLVFWSKNGTVDLSKNNYELNIIFPSLLVLYSNAIASTGGGSISFNDPSVAVFGTSVKTISYWFNNTGTFSFSLLQMTSGNLIIGLLHGASSIAIWFGDGISATYEIVDISSSLVPATWYHIMITLDGDNYTACLNGNYVVSGTKTVTQSVEALEFYLLSAPGGGSISTSDYKFFSEVKSRAWAYNEYIQYIKDYENLYTITNS